MFVNKKIIDSFDLLVSKVADRKSVFYGEFGGRKIVEDLAESRGVSVESCFIVWQTTKKAVTRHQTRDRNKKQVKDKKVKIATQIKEINNNLVKLVGPSVALTKNLIHRKKLVSEVRSLNKTSVGQRVVKENARKHRGPSYQRRQVKRREQKILPIPFEAMTKTAIQLIQRPAVKASPVLIKKPEVIDKSKLTFMDIVYEKGGWYYLNVLGKGLVNTPEYYQILETAPSKRIKKMMTLCYEAPLKGPDGQD